MTMSINVIHFIGKLLKNIDLKNIIFYFFIGILSIPHIIKDLPHGLGWTPSRAELVDGFLPIVKAADQIEGHIRERREFLRKKKCLLQPYVLAVGTSFSDITSYYIVMYEGMFYRVNTLTRAFDLAYKILWAANLCYSDDSKVCWFVLQKVIYGMPEVDVQYRDPLNSAAKELIYQLLDQD